MQVRQRLKINTVISVIMACIILLILSLALYRIINVNESAKIVEEIITGSYERVSLRNDYMRNSDERAKEQWFAKHEELDRLLKLAAKQFREPADINTLSGMLKDQESIGTIFSGIVKNREKALLSANSADTFQEIDDRLLSQLNMRGYDLVINARQLLESSREARYSALKLAGAGIVLVFLILTVATLTNSRMMSRLITERLQRLRDGAMVIGGGNLDQNIDVKGDDEFAELSDAFNKMTAQLRGSYQDLESEIELRKRAEEQLKKSYGELLMHSFDAIIVWRMDGGIESWNRGAQQMYGFTENEVLGRTTHKSLATIFPKPLSQIEADLHEKGQWEGELRHHTKDGREIIVSARLQLISGDDGVDKVLEINRDITERKRNEEQLQQAYSKLEESGRELKELNDTLELRIVERTAELQAANETLRASRVAALNLMEDALDARKLSEETNEELEFSNKELESFIYSVSHDLRGPLRHIAGFAELVMKDIADKLDEKGKRYLSRIHDGSEKMSRLIDDLLNLSRISRQEIKRRDLNMSEIAASIVSELHEANPSRSVEVDIKEGLTVFADRGLIEIVLSNLLGNAWKFTAKTEHARIELKTVERDGKIIYYVGDNGAGFDQQYAEKMFWPFHRLHSESEFEGTGIGLAIVDRIIRRHGGKIWAEGATGKGATIYFSLT
ncbi:MAG: ATP-binding protein [Dissulfurispiraceae bacterium]